MHATKLRGVWESLMYTINEMIATMIVVLVRKDRVSSKFLHGAYLHNSHRHLLWQKYVIIRVEEENAEDSLEIKQ